MVAEDRSVVSARLIWGVFILLAGIVFFLDQLDLIRTRDYIRFWPLVLVALGLFQVVQPSTAATAAHRASGAILVAVGGLFLLDGLGYVRFRVWDLIIPSVFVILGAHLVVQALARRRSVAESADSMVSAVAVLGGIERPSHSSRFHGGTAVAVLGGATLDLRQASMEESGSAVIDIVAVWGGVEIKVPEDWSVSSTVLAVLGGFEDKTRTPQGAASKRLLVKGIVVMGGAEIHN